MTDKMFQMLFKILCRFDRNMKRRDLLMDFPFKHSLSVRFSDVDGLGHTNNAAYITYFEEARLAMMRNINLKTTKTWQGFPFIVAHVSCDFKVATFGGDWLDVYCR